MSTGFNSFETIKRTRKIHRCKACRSLIAINSSAHKQVTTFRGMFFSGYFHLECVEAEKDFNHNIYGWTDHDDWQPLHAIYDESDPDDLDHLREAHPIAYAYVQAGASPEQSTLAPDQPAG